MKHREPFYQSPGRRADDHGELFNRITRIEANVEAVSKEVGQFIQAQGKMNEVFGSKFDSFVDLVNKQKSTNWSLIWSAIGVVAMITFSVGGATFKVLQKDIDSMKEQNTTMMEKMLDMKEEQIRMDERMKIHLETMKGKK